MSEVLAVWLHSAEPAEGLAAVVESPFCSNRGMHP